LEIIKIVLVKVLTELVRPDLKRLFGNWFAQ